MFWARANNVQALDTATVSQVAGGSVLQEPSCDVNPRRRSGTREVKEGGARERGEEGNLGYLSL